MKLLFIHERFGAFAGAESNLLHTAVELRRRGHTVGILHGAGTGRSEATWCETFANRYGLATRDNFRLTQAAITDFAPDVIYIHKMDDLKVLEALVTASVPVVHMVHDHEMYCLRGYKYHWQSREICTRPISAYCLVPCGAFLARNRDGIFPFQWKSYTGKKRELSLNQRFHRLIVASDYMKQELLRNRFVAEKIEIHPPVPPGEDSASRSSFSERNLLIYAGQIVRGKGVDILLESLARVKVPFECVVLGDGNHRSYCEALSRDLGLAGRVRFEGFIPQPLLKNYYHDATAMIMSSVWPEPFGAVGLEGMRHGLPVIAFDAGGIKEWLTDGHNGFLVPWMDRDCFARRVEQLLGNKTLARAMGERGRALVSQEYAFSRYIGGLESTFLQVVAETRGQAHA
jgi:glycosyltransferase involved in cell wall biosynthesis